jgi:hypothetical protein
VIAINRRVLEQSLRGMSEEAILIEGDVKRTIKNFSPSYTVPEHNQG